MDWQVSHPVEFFPSLIAVWHASQAGWDVPEANIGVLGLQTEVNKSIHTYNKLKEREQHRNNISEYCDRSFKCPLTDRKFGRLTTPSNTISYPSLFLILLYRYWDRSKHLSICCSNPMVPCEGENRLLCSINPVWIYSSCWDKTIKRDWL